MTIGDFYGVIKEAVKFAPSTPDKIEQLQTFAVLRHPSELNAEALDKSVIDKGKNFFYSRKWEALGYSSNSIPFEFPIVTAIPLRSNYSNMFGKRTEERIQLDLSVLYPNPEVDKPNSVLIGKARTREAVYDITKDLLLYVIGYAKTATKATIDGATGWHGRPYVDYLEGEGATVSIDEAATGIIKRRLHNENLNTNGNFVDDITAHRLIGRAAIINFPTPSCTPTIAPDFSAVVCCAQVNG